MRDEHPNELRILVHESMRADLQRRITRRQALMAGAGGALGLYLAGCGGSTGESGGGGGEEKKTTATDAKIEDRLLISNWVDYSDPANYKAYTKELGPKVTVQGYGSNDELLAKLRAGGSKFDIVVPTGYAVKTMIDQDLALELNRDLIPNLANLEDAFTKVEYDPGNKFSVPKDYGITSFYWLTDKVSEQPATMKEAFELLKTPKFRDLKVNFLEGATQVVGMALKGSGLSLNSEDQARARPGQAAAARRQAQRRHDQLHVHRPRVARRHRLRPGLERGHPAGDRRAEEEGPRDGVHGPRGLDRVLGRQLGHPRRRRAPGRRAQVDQLGARPGGGGQGDDLPPVRRAGEGHQGVPEDLAEDPIIAIPNETIERYETQLQTPKGQQLRDRVYTEFKAA